jgi:hypothetical protein
MPDGKKQISKAPEPINPLRGSLYIYSAPPTMTPIDWNYWRVMRKARHWKACALSVGANPDDMGRRQGDSWWSDDAYHADRLPKTVQETLTKRIKMLEANRNERDIFTLPMEKYSNLHPQEVFLSEFAAWALSLGWEMPSELKSMAAQKEPQVEQKRLAGGSTLEEHEGEVSADGNQTQQSAPVKTKAKNKWDVCALRQILREHCEVGMTHEKLAKKYGVKRQRVGAILKQAKEIHKQPKAIWTGPVTPAKPKK